MTNRHASKLTRAQRRDLNKKSRQLRQTKQRRMQYEPLEVRQLLDAQFSPQLVSIQPNTGELIEENDVRGIAPRSLTLNFAEIGDAGDLIDGTTVADGIVITRAGIDGKLGTADDVKITGPNSNFEGFIGIGDQPNEVVVRFGEALPDDLYRIQVTSALKDMEGQSAHAFTRNFELNLAPQVMSVVPQPVTRNQETGALEIARDMIYVYFNDDDLDPTLATNPDYYQLTFQYAESSSGSATNNDLGLGNDSQAFYPESVVYDPVTDMAMLQFSKPIEELIGASESNAGYASVFRLQIGVRGIASKGSQILDTTTLDGGTDAGSSFETAFNLSDLASSVDLQSADGLENYAPGTNLFAGNNEFRVTRGASEAVNHTTFTIDDGLGNLRTFELTTDGNVTTGNIKIDISSIGSETIDLAAAIRSAINNAASSSFNVSASTVTGFSTDRSQLRGTQGNRVSMILGNKTTGLIVDQTQALVIRGEIQNTTSYDIALPGGNDEPGHRDIELDGENHLSGEDTDGLGVTVLTYNFPEIYGVDPASQDGELLHNQITEEQMKRAREIFEIYSFYSGIEFIEVPNDIVANIGVVTGDLRALDPEIAVGEGGPIGLGGGGLAIMETADHDKPGDDEVGAKWQNTAFHEIGHVLGLQHTYDLPIGTIMGQDDVNLDFGQNVENLLPGDFDVTHLQHLYRPDVIDIDLYRFDVTETGTISAEIVAERLNDSSRLDAALTLYRRNGDGTYTAIARNNDYFSEDPFMELELEPGTYYIGVSASGNDVYDPNIEDSGFGGTSQGAYELQLRFSPTVNDSIRDTGSTVAQLNTMVVQADGSGFTDGTTITLKDGTQTRIFEFDNNGQLNDPNHVRVAILPTSLQSEIVAALVDAINNADFNVEATFTGNRIELDGLAANDPIKLDPQIIQDQSIVITSGAAAGAALDGDLDGIAGGNYNFWFRAEPSTYTGLSSNAPRTLFVDATYTKTTSTGSIDQPFKTIAAAIAAAKSANRGDVIRVIGLPGINDDPDMLDDNIAYLIGRDPLTNAPLRDGTDIVIPKGVTLMIDEGAILKFNNASIQVGSTSVTDDRSFAALQILGIPERYQPRTDSNGNVIATSIDTERVDRRVTLTSYRETTLLNEQGGERVGNASYLQGDASPGNWGGILFNQEVDREQQRGSFADSGIFLNSVIGAEFRYAGGITEVDGADVALAPIYLEESRPTINYNIIRLSAGAALSADPNSFEESNYTVYNGAPASFTPDIKRVGPDIFGNRVVNNSTNGMLVRIKSSAGQSLEEMTVTGRFDDTDMVYVIQEALHVDSTPGGAYSDMVDAIKVPHLSGVEVGSYLRFAAEDEDGIVRILAIQFVDNAFSSDPNAPSISTLAPLPDGSMADVVMTINLETELALDYTESRLAELIADRINDFRDALAFVGEGIFLDVNAEADNNIVKMDGTFAATHFTVDGFAVNVGAIVAEPVYVARLDASLVVDPNVVVKFNAGRIEVEMGANFIAEGAPGRPVVFTSLQDDRYGFGGTFDTNNNGDATSASEGDWSGIYFANASSGSIDQALIAYGGGESSVAGGLAQFNAVEIHQAVVRVTNSTFEYNADGYDETGQNTGGATRNGYMSNDNAVIFMRDSQSVVVGNNFRYNSAAVLSVDTSSLSYDLIVDWGRSTGNLDVQPGLGDNQGALIRRNLLTENDINGMVVRGGVLTTQSVWDDTDIVHVVFDTIYSTNFHTYGGIRIESSATESLVVKLLGPNAGFEATGTQLDIDDRIGGMLNVVGQAGFPVIFTDFRDDTVGAGFDQFGQAQNDTNNDDGAVNPLPGSWKGLTIDEFANDRNVQVVVESEANNLTGQGINGSPLTSQYLGQLAPDEYGGNDTQRLGYEVNGYLSNPADVDVYSFIAQPGTEVWFDIDKTSYFLDVVVELIDGDGNVLAASSNSYDQSGNSFYGQSGLLSVTNPLQKSGFYEEDLWSNNPRDAGMRVVLPGQAGTARTYHVRIRSNSDDLTSVDGNVMSGTTSGVYQLNVRLREVDEVAGSSIQFADIRYAENGISIYGQPGHSPVLGESSEDGTDNQTSGNAQSLGNVLNSDRAAISVAGELDDLTGLDVDWYQVNFDFDAVQSIKGTSDVSEYGSLIIDLDYAAGFDNANTIVSVYDSTGALIFISDRGAVNDDLMNPQTPGAEGLQDQSRGSANTGDPYLGTIMLPAGTPNNPITYYVAVSSQAQTSVQMDQFFSATAANTLVRLEPIDSVRRIVEDHIDSFDYYSTPTAPDSTSIINTDAPEENVNPYVLGDFTLFMSTYGPSADSTVLYALDPFTGAVEARVGTASQQFRDLAMSPDGTLYAYDIDSDSPLRDVDSGNFYKIDTGDASATQVTANIIETYEINPATGNLVRTNRPNPAQDGGGTGYGYMFEASTFVNNGSAAGLDLYAVGNRGDVGNNFNSDFANLLFVMDATNLNGDSSAIGMPDHTVAINTGLLADIADTNIRGDQVFRIDTSPVGGFVTGLAWIDNFVYAITDTGGLFLLNPGGGSFQTGPDGETINSQFITTLTDENGVPLRFESLTAGPARQSDGANTDYSDVLFGVTATGDIYAFNGDGDAQYVFQGNKASISTGLSGVNGLQFGTLNENLWHVTTNNLESTTDGHGISVPVDNSRLDYEGGSSIYFGNQDPVIGTNNPGYGNSWGNASTGDYNFPGDAHGSVITDTFSLYGYNASDLPTLYFTYMLDTEDQDFDYGPNPDMPATDAFRVFIAGDDGNWELLATNNTLRIDDTNRFGEIDDEFDAIGNPNYGDEVSAAAVDEELRADLDQGTEGVQSLFDNTGWRQARIDLGAFAGQENLRLRFDFSTGGSVNLGGYQASTNTDVNTEEIRVLKGSQIADGDSFTVTDVINQEQFEFEYNKGQSFIFDSAGRVADAFSPLAPANKNVFTLVSAADGTTSRTFQYVLDALDVTAGNVPIVITLNDSASEIRQKTEAAILNAFAGFDINIYDEAPDTFNIQGIVDLPQAQAPYGMTVIGSSQTTPGKTVIYYNSETTAVELATATQEAMNQTAAPEAYAQGYEMFNRFQEFIYGNGYSFDVTGSNLGHDGFLQGDDFGYASENRVGLETATNTNANQRGQDNLYRGVFFDDIIIGFAERGEMVTDATTANGFIHNLAQRENENLSGEYQLEIRRGTDYGTPEWAEFFGLNEGDLWLTPGFDFDTNDRLDQSYTIRTASGDGVGNGDRIRVSDGTDWVTFEFFDLDSIVERQRRGLTGTSTRTAYDADNNVYSIGFYNTDTEAEIATRLSNAINDHSGQIARGLISTTNGGLGVYAQLNSRSGVTTSDRVDLSPATTSDVVVVEYDVRSDDAIREAYDLDLRGDQIAAGTVAERDILGVIGDNDSVDKADGIADVDVYRFSMVANQVVEFTLSTFFANTIGVEGMLRLFVQNSNGTYSEVNMTLTEGATEDVYTYTAATTGNYFVSVAGNPAPLAANGNQAAATLSYDPTKVAKNDAGRQVKTYEGQYSLSMRVTDNLSNQVLGGYDFVNRVSNPETQDNIRFFTDPITGETAESIDIIRYDMWITDIPLLGIHYEYKSEGDSNRQRDQGQIIISSNVISNSANYGILVDAGDRNPVEEQESQGTRPHQGAPLNVPSAANANRLATGVTITNNVIYFNVDNATNSGAILYSGDSQGGTLGAVPFGRIINNTLYGTGSGDVGVRVEDAAGPTLMNNIIANFATGIQVADATSKANTVVSRTLFQGNGVNSPDVGTGNLPIILNANDPLFVDAAAGNFYLAEGSQAIDAAIDAIQERAEVSQVVNPLGIDSTPLLAPERDITGQLRVDDPNVVSSGGIGGVTFRDIGAFDRADFTGPTGYLFDPQDNDAANHDLDATPDIVQWISGPLTNISIQLLDEGEISDQVQGTGVDDSTVTTKSVKLEIVSSSKAIELKDGIDYTFDYDATNNIIRLVPISGVFQEGVLYKVTLDSDPESENVIRDIANNPIEFNHQVDDGSGILVGETRFLIQVGGLVDFGDAPDSYGTLLESDGARHNLVNDFYLGSSVDAEIDGQPTADASGDGSTDDGVYIRTVDPNNANSFLDFTLRDNITNEIYITATVPSGSKAYGFIDAWIDFNKDGDFTDPGEQILVSRALTIDAIDPAGSASGLGQLFKLSDLPDDVQLGDTMMRFRYSSTGGLSPTGLAQDGEVEDYQVTIGAAAVNPWHNSAKPLAVTKGDTSITGLDLNFVINELRNHKYTYSQAEANLAGKAVGSFKPEYDPDVIDPADVPAYLDINNDRKVTLDDLYIMLNYFTSGTVNPEPLDGEMIAESMASSEPPASNIASPVAVESQEIVASIISPAMPSTPAPASLQTESLIGSSSFIAVAPTYSELQMRSAAELMGLSTVKISDSQLADQSYVDEAIALDELCDDDQFGQLIGDMADDLSATWDAKNFGDDSDDSDSSEDDLDELAMLLSESGLGN